MRHLGFFSSVFYFSLFFWLFFHLCFPPIGHRFSRFIFFAVFPVIFSSSTFLRPFFLCFFKLFFHTCYLFFRRFPPPLFFSFFRVIFSSAILLSLFFSMSWCFWHAERCAYAVCGRLMRPVFSMVGQTLALPR